MGVNWREIRLARQAEVERRERRITEKCQEQLRQQAIDDLIEASHRIRGGCRNCN